MIHELDTGERAPLERRPVWVFPAVAAFCVLAFAAVAAGVSWPQQQPTSGATLVRDGDPDVFTVTAADLEASLPPGWEAARAAERGVTVIATRAPFTIESTDGGVLALPSESYEAITRLPNAVSGSTAQEEPLLQYRYRLNDGRFVVLVRVPRTDPFRGVDPSRYIASSLRLRDTDARVLVATGASQLVILVWTEGIRSYQLSSSTLSLGELASLAESLR